MPLPSNLTSALRTGARPTDELLLDVAAALHASSHSARDVGRALGESTQRVRRALAALVTEGLVEESGRSLSAATRYTLTADGIDALAQRGRFPGDVTVLFTDLVASTQLIGSHGELGAHELRLRHLALLRACVARAGGYEVKGLGDGLMVAFPDPAVALRCAVDMQRAVAGDADGLGLRVGVHTGAVLHEGGDLHGSTVITSSRLCDRAGSGEVLASAQTIAEAGGAAPPGFLPSETLVLKGLDEPVEAHRLGPVTRGASRSGGRDEERGLRRRAPRRPSPLSA